MKKLIAIIISVLMLAGVMTVAISADDAVCVTSNLDAIEKYVGSLVQNNTGTVNISGKSLQINTQNATYGLNGNPEDAEKYQPDYYQGARRHKLTAFDDGKVLPAGTYTVSIWVYENGNHLGNQLSHVSELALSLHTAEETDDTLVFNHKTAPYLIKLFKANAADTTNSFTASGETQKIGNRTWGQYTATITVNEPVSQFAFWIIIDGDVGEMATINNYIDDLAIYNEAGDPTPKETEPAETDPVETDPVETDPVETDPIVTDPIETDPIETAPTDSANDTESDTDAADGKGCGASIGAASAIVVLCGIGACVAAKKKKEN